MTAKAASSGLAYGTLGKHGSTSNNSNTVSTLGQSAENVHSLSQMQDISKKQDELIYRLRRSKQSGRLGEFESSYRCETGCVAPSPSPLL